MVSVHTTKVENIGILRDKFIIRVLPYKSFPRVAYNPV